ncbi:hypothetical protein ACL02S_21565 [Nocardia sp. 004]|uniref:hypothetical protein n=1 Tax=Nocardia sp. 004 TaxID=3385978 RepID=UPI00399F37FA
MTRIPHEFHVNDMQFWCSRSTRGRHADRPEGIVFSPPHALVRSATRFNGPTDPYPSCPQHYQLPRYEDLGTTGRFVVAHPGETSAVLPPHHDR